MFSTSEFYSYCRVHDVDVIPFDRIPAAATTVRYHGAYAVGLNFSRLHTVRQMRTAMLHESGHLHTGALHKVNSPFQLVEQNEYRADADAFRYTVCVTGIEEAFRRSLPPDEIRTAMRAGYTEPWQLAEYFDLDEDYIKKALHYWTQCRGIDFNR